MAAADGPGASVRPRFAYLDAPSPLAFAHRGAATDGLENSMPAFDRAVRLGFRYLETDVRLTRDGVLVAFHDATLDRTTDGRGRIAALRFAELAGVRIGGREPIPRLEDVLAGWPDVRVNIDVKVTAAVEPLVAAIRRTGAVERVCIGAFSDARLARIRAALGPRLCTSLGTREALGRWFASRSRGGGRGTRSGVPGCAQVPASVGGIDLLDRRFMTAAHRANLPVHAWTINQRVQMERLLDLGVDGIMTDDAELLRDVLVRRGQWAGRPPERRGAA